MDNDKGGNLPTGNSGGGEEGGYGLKSLYLRLRRDESPLSNSNQNSIDRQGAGNNRPGVINEENEINFLEGLEDNDRNGHEEIDSLASSSEPEYESINFENENGRVRADYDGQRRQNGFGFATFFGYRGFIRFPHVHARFDFASVVGAPVLGQGGLAVRLNGTSAVSYGDRPGASNSEDRGNARGNHAGPLGQRIGGGYGGMYGPLGIGPNMTGSIFYYTTTTAFAHRSQNGEVLSEMLSLRDSHIFNIMNATDYASALSQYCSNLELQEAMINHIECVKALLARNLPLALSKQITCVNAVMRLLNEAYSQHEEWTYPVIYTVIFDLRIISDRAISPGCLGKVIIRYDWAVNNVVYFYHPVDCQCRQPQVYRGRF